MGSPQHVFILHASYLMPLLVLAGSSRVDPLQAVQAGQICEHHSLSSTLQWWCLLTPGPSLAWCLPVNSAFETSPLWLRGQYPPHHCWQRLSPHYVNVVVPELLGAWKPRPCSCLSGDINSKSVEYLLVLVINFFSHFQRVRSSSSVLFYLSIVASSCGGHWLDLLSCIPTAVIRGSFCTV